jgi:hypothetical protein
MNIDRLADAALTAPRIANTRHVVSGTAAYFVRAGEPASPMEGRDGRVIGRHVEHFIQTSLREWAYDRTYQTSSERTQAMPAWIDSYNTERPHAGIKGLAPWTRMNNLFGNDRGKKPRSSELSLDWSAKGPVLMA